MGFYEQISKYYDYIFPVIPEHLKFITDEAGKPPAAVMDVACGSGGYAVELARAGYTVTAVDLDGRMVDMAALKARENRVQMNVFQCDMLELSGKVPGKFDCIYCIGNSIVHLDGPRQISEAFSQMWSMLPERGRLIIQIINYDRILGRGLSGLPPIRNDEAGLEFTRQYRLDKGIIYFDTVLTAGKGEVKERFENSISLYPLVGEKLMQLLREAGFGDISFYGDFARSPYTPDSYMLVASAERTASGGT